MAAAGIGDALDAVGKILFMVSCWPQSHVRPHLYRFARHRPETVKHRPCVTREIETRLPDNRVSYNRVLDHSPLVVCEWVMVESRVVQFHVAVDT